jgi:hypothetical protein
LNHRHEGCWGTCPKKHREVCREDKLKKFHLNLKIRSPLEQDRLWRWFLLRRLSERQDRHRHFVDRVFAATGENPHEHTAQTTTKPANK